MPDLTAALAAHSAHFRVGQLPEPVLTHLGLDLADGLAAIVGGSRAPGVESRE